MPTATLDPTLTAVLPSGESFAVALAYARDGSAPPTFTDPASGGMPFLRVNGGAPVRPVSVVWHTPGHAPKAMPYAVYALDPGDTVAPGAAVTLTVGSGQLVTSGGAVAAVTDLSIPNDAGGHYLPDAPSPARQMRLGWMTDAGTIYRPIFIYANLLKTSSTDWLDSNGIGTDWGTLDADGYPSNWGPYLSKIVTIPYADGVNTTAYYPVTDPGHYWLLWDGDGDVRLTWHGVPDGLHQEDGGNPGEYVRTGTTDNRRGFDLTGYATAAGPVVTSLSVFTTGAQTVRNVRLFDGHVADPLNPPRFHPEFLAKMAGTGFFRDKDAIGVDRSCPVGDYADYPTATWVGLNTLRNGPGQSVPITHIGPYNGGAGGPFARDAIMYDSVVLTTGVSLATLYPGGWPDGAARTLQFPHAPRPPKYTTVLAGAARLGGTPANLALTNSLIYQIDDTHLLALVLSYDPLNPVAEQDVPDGTVLCLYGNGMGYADVVEMVAGVAGCDLHHSIPAAATDACVAAEADLAAANLPADRTLVVEYTNEASFNFNTAYMQFFHCYNMGKEFALARAAAGDAEWAGNSNMRWYVTRAAQCSAIVRARWALAGRDPAKLRFVLGAQMGDGNKAEFMLAHAATHDLNGLRSTDPGYLGPCSAYFDGVVVAPYTANAPTDDGVADAVYDALTLEQVMDCQDALVPHLGVTQYADWLASHRASIAAHAPGLFLGTYEGGPAYGNLGGTRKAVTTVCWAYHPRARTQFLGWLAYFDSAGLAFYTKNGLASDFVVENGVTTCYGAYQGLSQLPGKGDGSDGLFDNRLQIADGAGMAQPLTNFRTLVSPVGLAVQQWSAAPAVYPLAAGGLVYFFAVNT